ncbi:hypothetical protein KY339_01400 [Candidatus Woesearchaeota archaeon]|nr:hypothetical protein [Candidatus Woesearchaeota archaeon]
MGIFTSSNLSIIKKLDEELRDFLMRIETIRNSHPDKLELARELVEKKKRVKWGKLKKEIERLREIIEIDSKAVNISEKFLLKALGNMKKIILREEMELIKKKDIAYYYDLVEIKDTLERIKPSFDIQLHIVEKFKGRMPSPEELEHLLTAIEEEGAIFEISEEIKVEEEKIQALRRYYKDLNLKAERREIEVDGTILRNGDSLKMSDFEGLRGKILEWLGPNFREEKEKGSFLSHDGTRGFTEMDSDFTGHVGTIGGRRGVKVPSYEGRPHFNLKFYPHGRKAKDAVELHVLLV